MTHNSWAPTNAPSAEVSSMIKLRWFWFVYKKILPTGEHPEDLLEPICLYPRRLLYHSTAEASIPRGWLEWVLPAEVMSGLKRTQVPSSSSSTTSTPLAGTSCASCSPSCRDKAQLGTWTEHGSCSSSGNNADRVFSQNQLLHQNTSPCRRDDWIRQILKIIKIWGKLHVL